MDDLQIKQSEEERKRLQHNRWNAQWQRTHRHLVAQMQYNCRERNRQRYGENQKVIQQRLRELEIPQKVFAKHFGVSDAAISCWCHGVLRADVPRILGEIEALAARLHKGI